MTLTLAPPPFFNFFLNTIIKRFIHALRFLTSILPSKTASQKRKNTRKWYNRKTPQPPQLEQSTRIPKTSQEAHERLRTILNQRLNIGEISHEEFMHGWIAMASIAPGLNPDEAASEDGSWPLNWKPIAAEAFRRFEINELTQKELYPKF